MEVLVVQHEDDAPAGILGDWATERGLTLSTVRPDRGEPLPDPERFPAAVVLGSTEFAIEGEQKWVDRELAWHHDVIEPPPNALVVARNPFGVQAFRHGRHLGVQFHPEATAVEVAAWAVEEPDALAVPNVPPALEGSHR